MGVGDSPQVIGRYAIHGKVASGSMAGVHFDTDGNQHFRPECFEP